MGITIIGLGPGEGRHLTREAWERITTFEGAIYIRTLDHPVLAEFPDTVIWKSFDALYEKMLPFQEVYEQIVDTIIEAATSADTDIAYAVPGHPFVAESTVVGICKKAEELGIDVEIIEGLSFIEPMLSAIGVDALNGMQLFDAITIAAHEYAPVNPDYDVLLGQVYNQMMASDLKLSLMAVYPPEYEVAMVHAAGTAEQIVDWMPLYQIDRAEHIRNLSTLYIPARKEIHSIGHLADSLAVLRSPNGCPWDQEQTPQSMRSGFAEEFAEVLQALDREDVENLCEELGDLLMHVVMQAQMASEAGDFTLSDVIAGIDAKMKRRHPHVWGDSVIGDSADVVTQWNEIKKTEKEDSPEPESIFDTIPLTLPTLAYSQKMQKKVAKVGFEWEAIEQVWDKIEEEITELKEAETIEEIQSEFGDVLFSFVNLARWLKIDSDTALREVNIRFQTRYQLMEELMTAENVSLYGQSVDVLESYWQKAKQVLKQSGG